MKTYIAGHTGLVGSALYRKLEAGGKHELLVATHDKLDLKRQSETEEFFKTHKIDWVFLAAARVGGILANSTYKAEFIYDNLAIAMNVVDAAYKTGVKKLLNLGSSCIYPKHAPQPMTEDALLTSPLESTNEAYAISKIAALKLCRYYNEQYGTNYISVMPTNLYGPHDNYNLETAHVLPAMLRKFHLAGLLRRKDFSALAADIRKCPLGFGLDKGLNLQDEKAMTAALKHIGIEADNVTLWGTGEVYREFLHVDDMAAGCLFLMENCDYQDIGEIINIGAGEDLKLKQLASLIRDAVGYEGAIKYDTFKPDGTPKKLLNISKIRALGWRPAISLPAGIKQSYEWYCSSQA